MTATAGAMGGPRSLAELLRWVREDYAANGRDASRPGFRALCVQRLGAYRRHVASPVLRKPLGALYRVLHRYVRNRYGIEIHATTVIGRRCWIAHQHGIVVHERAVIGDDCMLRQGVTLGQLADDGPRAGAPVLGDRVELGAGAVVVGPVHVGDGAVVGPNAVVMRDVPPGAIVMAPPARAAAPPAPAAGAGEAEVPSPANGSS